MPMIAEYSSTIERMLSGAELKNEAAVAKAMEITPQALSNFKSKGEIPADRVIQFARKFNLSVDWLLTGVGPMRREVLVIPHHGVMEERAAYGDDFVLIPRMSGAISAGGGLIPDETVEMKIAFRRDWIARKGDPNNMSIIRISGDSMEPTLLSGDLVLVDHGRNYVDPFGGLYAIALDHSVMVKRIQLIHTTGKLRIISDNPKYQPIEANPEEVKVNGKVIWFGREIER